MRPLSEQVAGALDSTRIGFGAGDDLRPTAALASRADRLFAPAAEAPAVGIVMTNDRPTVECLLAAVLTGARLVSLPLPPRGGLDDYAEALAAMCGREGVQEVVAAPRLAASLRDVGVRARSHDALDERPLAVPSPTGFRLTQFSSGTTQHPKPVVLDDHALGANVDATLERVGTRPGDNVVSWLPLSHDMGLVGMLLASIVGMGPGGGEGGGIVLLDPLRFMRAPGLWLEAIAAHRGSITATPDFGLRYATRRPPRHDVDLSSLRCVIVGAETVRADTLAGFTSAFAGRGVRDEAICPAYGMAEAGLAVSMTPPGGGWRSRRVASAALAEGRVEPPGSGDPVVDLVASGPALTGYSLRSTGGGDVGEIAVRGPSIGVDGRTGTSFAGPDGWMATGDEGFVDQDWVYVCGRRDEYLVAYGRNVYAPAVEAAAAEVAGVRDGRVAAVGLPDGRWALVAETTGSTLRSAPGADQLRSRLRRAVVRVAAADPDAVHLVRRGTLPVTTSGKIRRGQLRADLVAGRVGGPS
jgi:fatty-acyl-CoA synthase